MARRARRGINWVIAGLVLTGVSGCELFSEEEILEGERVRIRSDASPDDQIAADATRLPIPEPIRNVGWTQTNGLASHATGHLAAPATLTVAWQVDAGAGGDDSQITGAPVVVDGRVFVLDAEAGVGAFDAVTGSSIWRTSLVPEGDRGEDGFGGGLAYSGGTLVVTTGFGEVVGLNPTTGERIWTHSARAPFRAPPAASSGLVVAVTRENRAFGLSIATGDVAWQLDGVAASSGYVGGASPAINGPLVVIPFSSGEIVGVTRVGGRRVWSALLGGARRGQARSSIADVTGDPVIAGRIVVTGNQAGRMIAVDAQTGRRGWTRSAGSVGPMWAARDSLYVSSDDSSLVRIALRTGETLWRTPLVAWEDVEDREDPIAYSGPVLAGGRLLVTDSLGNLWEFDPDTGAEIGRRDLPAGTTNGVVVADGAIYVLTDDATLTAFR